MHQSAIHSIFNRVKLKQQIALNWRFDYTRQHGAHLGALPQEDPDSNQDENTSRLIPSIYKLPGFSPTISLYAIGSLIVSIIALTGTFTISEGLGESLSGSLGLILVVPIMLGTTAFGAYRHGVLDEWWLYSETSVSPLL